jgi:hypothetical protein
MGIYLNRRIYGLRIYNFKEDFENILFETKNDKIMDNEEIKKTFLIYNQLNDKSNIFCKIYTKSNKETIMDWQPISLNIFLETS